MKTALLETLGVDWTMKPNSLVVFGVWVSVFLTLVSCASTDGGVTAAEGKTVEDAGAAFAVTVDELPKAVWIESEAVEIGISSERIRYRATQ